MNHQVMLSPSKDRGVYDLCEAVARVVKNRPWKFMRFRWGAILVMFKDSAPPPHGKLLVRPRESWALRDHEILGIGEHEQAAAAGILRGESAKLVGEYDSTGRLWLRAAGQGSTGVAVLASRWQALQRMGAC